MSPKQLDFSQLIDGCYRHVDCLIMPLAILSKMAKIQPLYCVSLK
ncbi:hypothetical protein JCM19233_44 [Vibrio astriarenae]|nr:hypothetical protein JCM19233_44 [Vibrio sp. C7]